MTHIFRVHGTPKGQPRVKAFARKIGDKFQARVYDPGTAEEWKGSVALACKELAGARMIDPLQVNLTFYFPRPKAHYRSNGELKPLAPVFHINKPDADNVAKAVMDALTNLGAWADDSQVAQLRVTKFWQDSKSPPGATISIRSLDVNEL